MRIKLINSPFHFDEVSPKVAARWERQGKADFVDNGATLVFRLSFALSAAGQTLRSVDDHIYDEMIDYQRCGGRPLGPVVGEWRPRDTARRLPGCPQDRNLQFRMGTH